MKAINSYLVEKLKITKDIISKSDNKLKFDDDLVSVFSLYRPNKYIDEFIIKLYEPFKLIEISNTKDNLYDIIYLTTNQRKNLRKDCHVNEYGFLELDDSNSCTIYVKPKYMKEILELMISKKIFNPKYDIDSFIDILFDEYIDSSNKKILGKGKNLFSVCDYSSNTGVIHQMTRPKDIKDFITKHYSNL